MFRKENGEIGEYFIVIIMLIIIIVSIGSSIYISIQGYINEQEKEIVIKDKYVKNGSGKNSSSKYLVVDIENNTYQITDLFFKGKFNSTDLYNKLESGKKYKIKTTGNRIHYFSMYPNINEIEEVD